MRFDVLRFFVCLALIVPSSEVAFARGVRRNDASLPIFCKADFAKMKPLVIDYGALTKAFSLQYGWANHFFSRSATDYYLLFSSSAEESDSEKIFYDVEPYDGGIALVHMHIRLDGKFENLSGDTMCQKTLAVVNAF